MSRPLVWSQPFLCIPILILFDVCLSLSPWRRRLYVWKILGYNVSVVLHIYHHFLGVESSRLWFQIGFFFFFFFLSFTDFNISLRNFSLCRATYIVFRKGQSSAKLVFVYMLSVVCSTCSRIVLLQINRIRIAAEYALIDVYQTRKSSSAG